MRAAKVERQCYSPEIFKSYIIAEKQEVLQEFAGLNGTYVVVYVRPNRS